MKKSLSLWQLAGFIFTAVAGVLLHFLYNWSNRNPFVAPFSAVNESIWEHMKLLFFPMFVFALLESQFLSDDYQNFWCVKLMGIGLGMLLIPVLYYTYTGMFGISKDWINIAIFFLADAAAYLLETWLLNRENSFCKDSLIPLFVLFVIALAFIIFTFVPPQIPLFQEPNTVPNGIVKLAWLFYWS